MVIRGVVFDIDDTLYHERDYVFSGFRYIAALAGRSASERETLATWLSDAFEAGRRGNTFDRLLEAFPTIAERFSVEDLVEAYRGHPPKIELAPGVESALDTLAAAGLRLGILSDGPLVSQTRKADALRLSRWFDPMVFTASLGPGQGKPATSGFEAITRDWGVTPDSVAYVADNPEKDFAGPRSLGWLTIRIRQPGQLRYLVEPELDASRSELEIGSIRELLTAIRAAEDG